MPEIDLYKVLDSLSQKEQDKTVQEFLRLLHKKAFLEDIQPPSYITALQTSYVIMSWLDNQRKSKRKKKTGNPVGRKPTDHLDQIVTMTTFIESNLNISAAAKALNQSESCMRDRIVKIFDNQLSISEVRKLIKDRLQTSKVTIHEDAPVYLRDKKIRDALVKAVKKQQQAEQPTENRED